MIQDNATIGSHSGLAAFAYDFQRADKSTASVPIYASEGGRIGCYRSNGALSSNGQEQNFLEIEIQPKVWVLYMHMAPNSLNALAMGGEPDGDSGKFCFPEGQGPVIQKWGLVGRVGPGANHLHISLHDRPSDSGVTLPLAFTGYKKSSDKGETFQPVLIGYPRDDEHITRTR